MQMLRGCKTAQLATFMKAVMRAVGQRGSSLAERARSQRVSAWRF